MRNHSLLLLGFVLCASGIQIHFNNYVSYPQQCPDHKPSPPTKDIPAFAADILSSGIEFTQEQAAREAESADWGNRVTSVPDGVARPTSCEQIQTIVQTAKATNVKLVARSTGHGWGGTAIVSQAEGGIMVSLKNLKTTTVNSDGTATVQAGASWAEVVTALDQHSPPLTIPTGIPTPVLSVGGCISVNCEGAFSNKYGGPASEHALLQLRVITGNGDLVVASPQQNVDVFNAVRGTVGQMGIICEAVYVTTPRSNVRLTPLVFKTAAEGMSAFRRISETQQGDNKPAWESTIVDTSDFITVLSVPSYMRVNELKGNLTNSGDSTIVNFITIITEYTTTPPSVDDILDGVENIYYQPPFDPITFDMDINTFHNRLVTALEIGRQTGEFEKPHAAIGFWALPGVALDVLSESQLVEDYLDVTNRPQGIGPISVSFSPQYQDSQAPDLLPFATEMYWIFHVSLSFADVTLAQEIGLRLKLMTETMQARYATRRFIGYQRADNRDEYGVFQFGPRWPMVVKWKEQFDPRNIFGGNWNMWSE